MTRQFPHSLYRMVVLTSWDRDVSDCEQDPHATVHLWNNNAEMPSRRETSGRASLLHRKLGEVPLLLVIYRNAFELLALRIGSVSSDGAHFAIGRHDNFPGNSSLPILLYC